ncbi:MAG: hypothetical protein HYV05_00520 [Deltaproteobacteria bacterium]|nr:hypothetical protein [Deltaproteobacteria bacterium]MBI2347114.1 hypothetical protein [Deltaproteobacteria bacterium]
MVIQGLPVGIDVNLLIHLSSVNLWLHVVSLALWVGAIAFFLFVFGPAVRTLPAGAGIQALNSGRRSLEALSWIAMTFVLITGLFNLVLRGAGSGFELGAGYTTVLSLKLFLFLAMVFHHFLQALKYAPEIASHTARAKADLEARFDSAQSSTEAHSKSRAEPVEAWPEPLLALWKRWFLLLKINATLGQIALLLGLGLARG